MKRGRRSSWTGKKVKHVDWWNFRNQETIVSLITNVKKVVRIGVSGSAFSHIQKVKPVAFYTYTVRTPANNPTQWTDFRKLFSLVWCGVLFLNRNFVKKNSVLPYLGNDLAHFAHFRLIFKANKKRISSNTRKVIHRRPNNFPCHSVDKWFIAIVCLLRRMTY